MELSEEKVRTEEIKMEEGNEISLDDETSREENSEGRKEEEIKEIEEKTKSEESRKEIDTEELGKAEAVNEEEREMKEGSEKEEGKELGDNKNTGESPMEVDLQESTQIPQPATVSEAKPDSEMDNLGKEKELAEAEGEGNKQSEEEEKKIKEKQLAEAEEKEKEREIEREREEEEKKREELAAEEERKRKSEEDEVFEVESMDLESWECPIHPPAKRKYYCFDSNCKRIICKHCMNKRHATHMPVHLKLVAQQLTDHYSQQHQIIDSSASDIIEKKKETELIQFVVGGSYDINKDQFKKLNEAVSSLIRDKINQIDQQHKKFTKDLQDKNKEFDFLDLSLKRKRKEIDQEIGEVEKIVKEKDYYKIFEKQRVLNKEADNAILKEPIEEVMNTFTEYKEGMGEEMKMEESIKESIGKNCKMFLESLQEQPKLFPHTNILHFFKENTHKLYLIDLKEKKGRKLTLKTHKIPIGCSSVKIKKSLLLTGGYYKLTEASNIYLNTTFELNQKDRDLSPRANMHHTKAFHAMLVLPDTSTLCIGGINNISILSISQIYSYAHAKWNAFPALNSPKYKLSLCLFGNPPLSTVYAFAFSNPGSSTPASSIEAIVLTPTPAAQMQTSWQVVNLASSSVGLSLALHGAFQISPQAILLFGGTTNSSLASDAPNQSDKESSNLNASNLALEFDVKNNTIEKSEDENLFKSDYFCSNSFVRFEKNIYCLGSSNLCLHVYNVDEGKWRCIEKERWREASAVNMSGKEKERKSEGGFGGRSFRLGGDVEEKKEVKEVKEETEEEKREKIRKARLEAAEMRRQKQTARGVTKDSQKEIQLMKQRQKIREEYEKVKGSDAFQHLFWKR
jgi:hypothetical protein